MFYVQRRGQGYLETVDEFTTRKEAVEMLREYRLSDPSANYYLSTRPCKAWYSGKGHTSRSFDPVSKPTHETRYVGLPYGDDESGHVTIYSRYRLTRDGNFVIAGTEFEILAYMQRHHPFSLMHAINHEGYRLEPVDTF